MSIPRAAARGSTFTSTDVQPAATIVDGSPKTSAATVGNVDPVTRAGSVAAPAARACRGARPAPRPSTHPRPRATTATTAAVTTSRRCLADVIAGLVNEWADDEV